MRFVPAPFGLVWAKSKQEPEIKYKGRISWDLITYNLFLSRLLGFFQKIALNLREAMSLGWTWD